MDLIAGRVRKLAVKDQKNYLKQSAPYVDTGPDGVSTSVSENISELDALAWLLSAEEMAEAAGRQRWHIRLSRSGFPPEFAQTAVSHASGVARISEAHPGNGGMVAVVATVPDAAFSLIRATRWKYGCPKLRTGAGRSLQRMETDDSRDRIESLASRARPPAAVRSEGALTMPSSYGV